MTKLKSFSQLRLPAEVEALRKQLATQKQMTNELIADLQSWQKLEIQLRKELADAGIDLAAKTEQLKDLREKYRIAFTALDAIGSNSSDARDVAQARQAMQECVDVPEQS